MPNPTQGDVHVNAPLTNISVAYIQDEDKYIATKVFPRVPVQKQSDLFWRYHKSEWRRTDVEKRAPSTETPGVGWNVFTDQYFAHVYGVHKDVDDQLRANADSAFNLDRDATKFVTQQLLIQRDIDWMDTFFTEGTWEHELDGSGADFVQWNEANSTPIEDIQGANLDIERSTTFRANTIVQGPGLYDVLRNHDQILERIKYTQRGVISADLLASFFEVDKFLVARASRNLGAEHQDPDDTDENAEYEFMADDNMLLVYANPSPSLMTPSGGYVFTWNGYLGGNDRGIRIKRFRLEQIASDRIEAEMTYDMKQVSEDVGAFFHNTLAS